MKKNVAALLIMLFLDSTVNSFSLHHLTTDSHHHQHQQQQVSNNPQQLNDKSLILPPPSSGLMFTLGGEELAPLSILDDKVILELKSLFLRP